MQLKQFGVRTVIIGIALIAGIGVGTLSFGPAIANSFANRSQAPAPVYPKNENGQTYGSGANAISLETEPDLVEAQGIDGTVGYVRSVDLNEPMPKTPEEALAQQKSRAGKTRKIPLYKADGKTVIGEFNIGGGEVIETPAK